MRTIVVFGFIGSVLASPALATNWPLMPLDSVHPLGNNWGNYQDYGGGPYFHNGIDVITPDVQGRRTMIGRPLGSPEFASEVEATLDRQLAYRRPGRPRKTEPEQQ